MNLMQEFGPRYVNDRSRGAVFVHPEGWTGIMEQAYDNGEVEVTKVEGNVGRLSVEKIMLPHDYFTGLKVFDVPELGWRTAQNGRMLVHLRQSSGYSRGVSPRNNLITEYSDMTQYMFENRAVSQAYYQRQDVMAKLITTPEYLTLADGIKQMREGEIASFAMSPILAACATDDENVANLYVRTRVVGTINLLDGSINTSVSLPNLNNVGEVAA